MLMIFVLKPFKYFILNRVCLALCGWLHAPKETEKTEFDSLKLPSVRAVNQTEDFCSWFMLLISDPDHQSHDTSAI